MGLRATRAELMQPGLHPVDSNVTCVLTRFGVRSSRDLAATYRDYRRVASALGDGPVRGLLRNAFLVESTRTCYSLSIWSSPECISTLGLVPEHIDAGGSIFGRLARSEAGGPELWSTKWRLVEVSRNLNWDGFDLRREVAEDGYVGRPSDA
jgi:hypothetical protein